MTLVLRTSCTHRWRWSSRRRGGSTRWSGRSRRARPSQTSPWVSAFLTPRKVDLTSTRRDLSWPFRVVRAGRAIRGSGVDERERREALALLRDLKAKHKTAHRKTMERAARLESGAEPPAGGTPLGDPPSGSESTAETSRTGVDRNWWAIYTLYFECPVLFRNSYYTTLPQTTSHRSYLYIQRSYIYINMIFVYIYIDMKIISIYIDMIFVCVYIYIYIYKKNKYIYINMIYVYL